MLLEKQATKQMKEQKNTSIKRVKAMKDLQEIKNSWYLKKQLTNTQLKKLDAGMLTLKDAKALMIAKIEKEHEKELAKRIAQIQNIKAQKFVRFAKCEIDWRRSATWGANPGGCYRNGFKYQEYKGIGGCGYDKLSTLTAQMFNEDVNLMSYIFNYCEKHAINKDNIQKKLGYGISIFNGVVHFDGGVGVECHISILKKLGFNVWHAGTRNSDIIEIDRKNKNRV